MKTFLSVFVTTVCCADITFAAQERVHEGIVDGQQDQNALDQDREYIRTKINDLIEEKNKILQQLGEPDSENSKKFKRAKIQMLDNGIKTLEEAYQKMGAEKPGQTIERLDLEAKRQEQENIQIEDRLSKIQNEIKQTIEQYEQIRNSNMREERTSEKMEELQNRLDQLKEQLMNLLNEVK